MVQLYKGGEKEVYLVHRLVAQTFLNNPEEYPIVNHKDENPLNNCVENLEWCTVQYNNTYGSRIEKFIKSKSIPVMCVETGEVFSSYKEAQEKTGIFASAIGACARGDEHFHTAGGYHWE